MKLRELCLILLLQVICIAASSHTPKDQQKSKSPEICLSDTSVEGGDSSCKEKVCMPPGDWWKESHSEVSNKGYRVEHCPKGWIVFKPNKCLKGFIGTKKPHSEAEKDCASQGAHLASVVDKAEHEFLVSYVLQNSKGEPDDVWLGGTQKGSKFFWSDYKPFDYKSWANGHPGDDGDKCVYLVTGKEMDKTEGSAPTMGVKSCDEPLGYVCQKCQSEERRIFFIRSNKDKSDPTDSSTDEYEQHGMKPKPDSEAEDVPTDTSEKADQEDKEHGFSKPGKKIMTKHSKTKTTEESSPHHGKEPSGSMSEGEEEMTNPTTTPSESEPSEPHDADSPPGKAKKIFVVEETEPDGGKGKGKGKGKRRRITTTRKTTTEEGSDPDSDPDSAPDSAPDSDTGFEPPFKKFHPGRGKGKGKRKVTKIYETNEDNPSDNPDPDVHGGNQDPDSKKKRTTKTVTTVDKKDDGDIPEENDDSSKSTTTTTKTTKKKMKLSPKRKTEPEPEPAENTDESEKTITTTTTKKVIKGGDDGSEPGSTRTKKIIKENDGDSGSTTRTKTTKTVIKEGDDGSEPGSTRTKKIIKENDDDSGSTTRTKTTKTVIKEGDDGSESTRTTDSSTDSKDKDKKPEGFVPVYAMGDPGEGIGGFDLKFKEDRSFAIDYDHSGKLDHIVLYRPGSGIIQILKNTDGTFSKVYPGPDDPVNKGIGIWDLFSNKADVAFAFDYESNGKPDHLVVFRPGFGDFAIAKQDAGKFSLVYPAERAGQGIGGWDFKYGMDRAFAFDYDHSGKMDHIVAYRAGTGGIFIIKNNRDGTFAPVYGKAAPFNSVGIGGFNLKRPHDMALAYDYDSSGKMDHMVLYRPGSGTVYIVKNVDGAFSAVYSTEDGGIGGFDMKKPGDRIMAYDYDGSGRQDHLLIYRPGTGSVYILKNSGGKFTPVYSQPDPGAGIGKFDLKRANDQAYAFDYEHSGKPEYIVIYRAGRGAFYILRNDNHEHSGITSGSGSSSGEGHGGSSSSTRRISKTHKSSSGGSGEKTTEVMKSMKTVTTYEEEIDENGNKVSKTETHQENA